jgi:hypothetical protein
MSTVFSGYVASERRVLSFSSLAGPDADFELVSADAERFAGAVTGERRVSSSSSLTGADQTLSSYPRSPIAFSDGCPARDQPSCTLTLSGVRDISSSYQKIPDCFSQINSQREIGPIVAISQRSRKHFEAHIRKRRLLSQTIVQRETLLLHLHSLAGVDVNFKLISKNPQMPKHPAIRERLIR